MNKIDDAFTFYSHHINDKEKLRLLNEYHLPVVGSVASVMWELFAAILTGRSGNGATGLDLDGWEVKSSKDQCAFEYQYHRNTGLEKMMGEYTANHLFISYSETYDDVSVRVIDGRVLAKKFFKCWKPEYMENYRLEESSSGRQRFRKSIPYKYVNITGTPILEITNGVITSRSDNWYNSVMETINKRQRAEHYALFIASQQKSSIDKQLTTV